LAGDRELNLLRQAYLEGHLQPHEARPSDRLWWRKLDWIFAYLEDRNRLAYRQVIHSLHAGALDYTAKNNAFDHHWKQAIALEEKIRDALLPWDRGVVSRRRGHGVKALADSWKTLFGDYNDPAIQQKVLQTIQAMYRRAAQDRMKRKGKRRA
jgi:hypothetical protein